MSQRPIEGLCPVCSNTFTCPVRKQGGGARKKYCSAKCRSLDWVRGNGGKRKATILKYEAGKKDDKRARTRRATLRQYGWTEGDFEKQLVRQQYSCYGCLGKLTREAARIDHSHTTEQVRGLLCNHCNWALGHTKDNPATLRRLMAHLDYDITKTNVYLIGALKNPRIPQIGNQLRAEGFDVMDEWFTPGELADINWQQYEKQRGRSYVEALNGRAATNIFLFDRAYLDHADAVVLVMPAGKSAMLELGYAKGRGKPTYIVLDGEPDRYDVMTKFADHVYDNVEQLVERLKRDDSYRRKQSKAA